MARALRRRKSVMAYVIASTCIDVKDGACQEACPVECIYESGRMMVIQPDECIDCGLCPSVCPVDAIYASEDLPEGERVRTRQRRILRSRGHGLGLARRRRFDPRQRARSSARRDARQVTSKRTRAGNLEHDESGRHRRRRDANGRARAISCEKSESVVYVCHSPDRDHVLTGQPEERTKAQEKNLIILFVTPKLPVRRRGFG